MTDFATRISDAMPQVYLFPEILWVRESLIAAVEFADFSDEPGKGKWFGGQKGVLREFNITLKYDETAQMEKCEEVICGNTAFVGNVIPKYMRLPTNLC